MALSGHLGAAVSQQTGGLLMGAEGMACFGHLERTGRIAVSLHWRFCPQKAPWLGLPSPSSHPILFTLSGSTEALVLLYHPFGSFVGS